MKKSIFVLLFIFSISISFAQTFRAGGLFGFNATQIDGDDLNGFSRFGFNGGFFADLPLKKKWSASMEILYSQKGCKSAFALGNPVNYTLRLNYAEVPFLLNYHDKEKINFGLGVSFNRLVSQKVLDGNGPVGLQVARYTTIKKNDYDFLFNGNYVINEHWIFNIRYAYSIFPFATWVNSNFRNRGQYNNVVTVRMGFIF